MRSEYDAIVIGSGFGGGVSACRLAEAGWRVCVLERGRRFGRGDFADGPDEAPRLLWHHKVNPSGLYDVRLFGDVSVLCAAGVGGGSLLYANVQLSAKPDVFDDLWPADVGLESLEPYYRRVEEALEPLPTPDIPKTRAFAAAGESVGRTAERTPVAVHFGEDRLNPFGGAHQKGCTHLGRCITGCPRHAKNSIDLTYLARAERNGADVYPLHEARRVGRRAGGRPGWRVEFRDLQYLTRGAVEAPIVILAAGTIGSSRLLMKNRRRLPRLSRALGTRFSANGNALGAIFDPRTPQAQGAQIDYGPTITSKLDHWSERRFLIEDLGLPPSYMGLLAGLRGAKCLVGWRRQLLRAKQATARHGLSDRSMTPREAKLRVGDPGGDALAFLFIGEDASDGRMRLTPLLRRFDVTFSKDGSRALFDAMDAGLSELSGAIGGTPFFSLDNGPLGQFVTAHPLGGCPMADDPTRGVVDGYGRVYGYEESLRVLDGSIIPSALGANPSKTIAALAERGVAQLIEERGR